MSEQSNTPEPASEAPEESQATYEQFSTTKPYKKTVFKKLNEFVTVRLLSTDANNGKYAIMDVSTKETYLVSIEDIKWTVKDQEVSRTVLDNAERPYDWSDEINAMRVSEQDIRIALYKLGFFHQSDIQNFKKIFIGLANKGMLPLEGNKNG